MKGFVQFS